MNTFGRHFAAFLLGCSTAPAVSGHIDIAVYLALLGCGVFLCVISESIR